MSVEIHDGYAISWIYDRELPPRTDRLYADFTFDSHLLPVERPWLFHVGDIVRVGAELVLITDGFLHVQREMGAHLRCSQKAGSMVYIIASATSEGTWL